MNQLAHNHTSLDSVESLDLSAIDFEVERQPIYAKRDGHQGWVEYKEIPDKFEFFRTDTGVSLGVHTSSYTHNGYKKHINGVLEAVTEMEKQGTLDTSNAVTNFSVYEEGRKLKLDITFPRHVIEPAIGDITKLRLRDWDSYDGSWGRRVVMDGLRLWCLNGCTSPAFKLGFYSKHTKSLSSDEKINKMIGSMGDMLTAFNDDEEKFKRWIKTPVEHDDAMQVFSKTIGWQKQAVKVNNEYFNHSVNVMDTLSSILSDNISQSGRNMYSAYNAATEWSTHVGQTKGQTWNVERTRESKVATMLNSKAWNNLERAH